MRFEFGGNLAEDVVFMDEDLRRYSTPSFPNKFKFQSQ